MRKMELLFKDLVCKNDVFINKLKDNGNAIKIEERKSKSRMEISFNDAGLPAFKSFQQVRILYQILLDTNVLMNGEVLHFVRTLKGLVEQEICRHKPDEISRPIKLIRDYFQREVTEYRTDQNGTLKPDHISLIEKFYKALRAGLTLNTKTDSETELYTKVYLAYFFEDAEGSRLREPGEVVTLDTVMKGVVEQVRYDEFQKSQSKDITVNNVLQNGTDILNYVYSGVDE